MIKKITIKDEYRTIPLDFSLELEKMTTITGKNNSGKTNFIKVVAGEAKAKKGQKSEKVESEFFDEKNSQIIDPTIVYVGAENINPSDSESNSSAKTSGLIRNLSKLFTNLEIKLKLEELEKVTGIIKVFKSKTNENLKKFTGSGNHEIDLELNEQELKADAIIQALIKDIPGVENGEKRELSVLGQGTQRIIVASILKAYVDILIESKKHTEKPILILFEEPEIYLHPELKRILNATLGEIANQPNHQVIITTHDPYFAYTNLKDEESVIYSFFRDANDKTDKKEPNVIFGIEDELLHIHLFERVLRKAGKNGIIDNKMYEDGPLDKYLKGYCNGETRDNIFPGGKTHNLALPLHIRHVIHHPLDTRNKFNDSDLEKSVKILNKILSE